MSNSFKTLIRYEWASFTRNRMQVALMCCIFILGIFAIAYGGFQINNQKQTIDRLLSAERSEFEGYANSFDADMKSVDAKKQLDIASKPAFAWFRHGYHAVLPPHELAALALGQRDLYRYYYRLTGMSLHYQLFENEIANPYYLRLGNLDLSFLIIYIFPLLIIVFCHSLYSAEKENGILPLLLIQAVSIRKIVLTRLLFCYFIIATIGITLAIIGFMICVTSVNTINLYAGLAWSIGIFVYCTFWFGLMFFLVSFRRSTAFNAIVSAGLWVLFLIIIPAMLNISVDTKYPLDSTKLAGLTRRTGLENENDETELREVIQEFLVHSPQYAIDGTFSTENLGTKAYAAFSILKDVNSQNVVVNYNTTVKQREEWVARFKWLNPAVMMQETLSQIVKTDITNYLDFQAEIKEFHNQITDFYFDPLFKDKLLIQNDYNQRPVFKLNVGSIQWNRIFLNMGAILMLGVLFLVLGVLQLNQK